jgi:hypothetical protein
MARDLFRELEEFINLAIVAGYKVGYLEGVTAYAWWKDGEQQVGTTGMRLKDVQIPQISEDCLQKVDQVMEEYYIKYGGKSYETDNK